MRAYTESSYLIFSCSTRVAMKSLICDISRDAHERESEKEDGIKKNINDTIWLEEGATVRFVKDALVGGIRQRK